MLNLKFANCYFAVFTEGMKIPMAIFLDEFDAKEYVKKECKYENYTIEKVKANQMECRGVSLFF